MPHKTQLTSKQIAFIKKNRLKISGADMAKKFGVTKCVVNNYMRHHGLSVPYKLKRKFIALARTGFTTSTPKIDKLLTKHYLNTPVKRMATMIGRSDTFVKIRLRQLGLKQTRRMIEKFKKDSQIKKGNIPMNKGKSMTPEMYKKCKATMFKKGRINFNELYDGAITIRHSHQDRKDPPYYHIRLAKGKWIALHTYNWEKINGKVPEGHCLWFKDGNSLNPDPDNMELITRAENMRRNSCSLRLTDSYVAFTICGKNNLHLYKDVLKRKDLIEVKRQQLLLRRKIREYDTPGN
jgi:hypothetical protein